MIQEILSSSMVQGFLAWPYAPYAAAFAVTWLLFAVFSSIGAAQKGRSSLGWFIVGLLFGFFGLLVYAMPDHNLPAGRRARQPQRQPAPRYVGGAAWMVVFGFVVFVGVIATSITIA